MRRELCTQAKPPAKEAWFTFHVEKRREQRERDQYERVPVVRGRHLRSLARSQMQGNLENRNNYNVVRITHARITSAIFAHALSWCAMCACVSDASNGAMPRVFGARDGARHRQALAAKQLLRRIAISPARYSPGRSLWGKAERTGSEYGRESRPFRCSRDLCGTRHRT